jgi:radical SAM protein with 4Fe4S-binding SPASM domain
MTALPVRFINLLSIVSGFLVSRITGRVIHWGFPAAISIETNNTCNLHCPECPAGTNRLTRERGSMDLRLYRSVIAQLSPHLHYLTLYFQGEPYLHSQLFEFIRFAKSKGIFVATSTNGHFFDSETVSRTLDSGLDRLIISLDGNDQESYASYRIGGDFGKVISGIRLLTKEKRKRRLNKPKIVLQCLVLKTNEDRLGEISKMAGELGADKVEFKTAQFINYENGNPLMPDNPKYSRYARQPAHRFTRSPAHQFTPKNRMPDSCFRMWSSCVITWDGKVVPCCFDKDAGHVMGDLAESSFAEIWMGGRYREFRRMILNNRKSIPMCTNCT